ncbi:uncharacterized protein LOC114156822 [Xiphophorus couchianus]|uniref:uncharacterized protein LOC114156822 n=1 Tax=Xiphophorus couchianus TaxID=32473 RepID=UPI0010163608|nr:uncharacterized protein LOC114156822 [Xiphophorus couchianus]
MALPADGSPMLEGHPDNGKEQGKLWLNEADTVSEDHGEELRYSSSPQFVDCSTSSCDSNITSSSGSSTTSSSGSSTTSSSGSSTTSSSEDEVGNGDQDFKSRFRVVQVLGPNIKFLWGIGVLEEALKLLKSTVDLLDSGDSSLADVASQLPEILPPNFRYIQDIGVARKPKEDMAPCTSQEEPILHLEKSRRTTKKVDAAKEDNPPSKPSHQVGLKEDAAHVTSVTRDSVAEVKLPAKRPRDTVAEEELAAKRTKYSVPSDDEDPIVLPPVLSLSPWKSCEDPGLPFPILSPSTLMHYEDPILSPCVFSPSPSTHYDQEELAAKKTKYSVLSFPYDEDAFVLPPVLSLSPWTSCEYPILSSPVLSPSCIMARKSPVFSSPVPVLSPSTLMQYEDPILSPSVSSLPPTMLYEDPILSPRIFSPSPSTRCDSPTLSPSSFCSWLEAELDTEEAAIPSTSSGITARESSRNVWFRPHCVLSSDSD